jgi:hypothetical protein
VFVVYPHDGIIYVFSNMKFMILLFMLHARSLALFFRFRLLHFISCYKHIIHLFGLPRAITSPHSIAASATFLSLFFPSSTAMKTVYGIFFPALTASFHLFPYVKWISHRIARGKLYNFDG